MVVAQKSIKYFQCSLRQAHILTHWTSQKPFMRDIITTHLGEGENLLTISLPRTAQYPACLPAWAQSHVLTIRFKCWTVSFLVKVIGEHQHVTGIVVVIWSSHGPAFYIGSVCKEGHQGWSQRTWKQPDSSLPASYSLYFLEQSSWHWSSERKSEVQHQTAVQTKTWWFHTPAANYLQAGPTSNPP